MSALLNTLTLFVLILCIPGLGYAGFSLSGPNGAVVGIGCGLFLLVWAANAIDNS